MGILIDERYLHSRANKIRRYLLAINPRVSCDRTHNDLNNSITIFAKDNSVAKYKDFFKTNNSKIKASYFEVWKSYTSKKYELFRIYFQICVIKDINEYSELLSFHVDMDVNEECYKKYPHLHIKHPKFECISDAHISLNLNDYNEIIRSIDDLDKNIIKVLNMINSEFISRFSN